MKKTSIIHMAVCASIAVYAVVFATGCQKKQTAAVPETAEPEEIVYAVNGFKVSPGNLDEYLEFGGDVAPVSSVDVIPDQAGKISRILVNVGDSVQKDGILAYVDASRPGMNYKASPVKSPIAGRVVSFTPTIGSTVSQSMSIAKISSTNDLEIKTSVAERFISRIKNGQQATVSFDAYPDVKFSAQVFEVSPVLDTSTRTMAIKLRITPPDSRVKVGMYARIRLVTDSVQDAIVVPSSAIVSREGESYVFIVSGTSGEGKGAVRLQSVTKGITVDDKTEITSGLSVGDIIIHQGQSLLNDGSSVNVLSVEGGDA